MCRALRNIFVAFVAIISCHSAFGQDIHFSQFYASPLTLNPAMTGLMEGCYRGAINYRNQYSGLAPYNTVSASYDMVLLRNRIGNTADHLGAGIMFFNDKAGFGSLTNTSVMGSVAYHKAFDKDGRIRLSLGFQGGLVHKALDFSKLTFENQLVGTGFDPSQPNGEAIEDNVTNYFDMRAGGILSVGINKNVGLYIGGASFHLTEPTESFLGQDNTLDSRMVVHAGVNIYPTNSLSITPNFIYMSQAGASELNTGALVGYYFDSGRGYRASRGSSALYIGGQMRLNPGSEGDLTDAFIILAGVEYNEFRFGVSYDITISDLANANNGQGGIELSLIYEMNCEPQGRRSYPPTSCPRF